MLKNILLHALLAPSLLLPATLSAQISGTYIHADDANIQYMGRIDYTNPKAPAYSFPGVTIKASFNGTSIYGVIKDYSSGAEQYTNYYEVVVDNTIIKKLPVNNIDTLYVLASGLSNTNHTLELIKRTESSVGKSSFKGFVIEGVSLLTPPAAASHRIEFIGDSWTCGYGNEVSTNSPNTGFHSKYEDNYRTWGYTIAKKFNTQYHATAISGRGMYRNNTGTTNGVLADEFDKIFPGQSFPQWNFSSYVPDLVVIHLGTNDWYPETLSTPDMLDSASFVDKYISFINTLRTNYGSATKIICAFGNSKSDWWPEGLKHLTRWRNYITAVVDHFHTSGDNFVYKFELAVQNAPYGEDWHPTIVTHNQMANEIAPYIASITGWSDNGYEAPTEQITTEIYTAQQYSSIKVYPNPTKGNFSIEGVYENTVWTITDSAGRIRKNGTGFQGNISEFDNGIYFFRSNEIEVKIIKH